MADRPTKAQVLRLKQDNLDIVSEILAQCSLIQQVAATEGDEATMWGAATEAWRARRAYDATEANLDRLLAKVEGTA
jgi:hypothetical protein